MSEIRYYIIICSYILEFKFLKERNYLSSVIICKKSVRLMLLSVVFLCRLHRHCTWLKEGGLQTSRNDICGLASAGFLEEHHLIMWGNCSWSRHFSEPLFSPKNIQYKPDLWLACNSVWENARPHKTGTAVDRVGNDLTPRSWVLQLCSYKSISQNFIAPEGS